MLTPHLRPRKNRFPSSLVKKLWATDTLREWKESNAERNGKTGERRLQRGHVTRKGGKKHGRRLDIRTKKFGEKFKDPGEYKKHSRFKEYGNQMGFHVASSHGKVVQAIELHEWRKHRHQHDKQEHDFGHLALHKASPWRSWKK